MEFLKEILGEELFTQFESKINEYNGNEANKDKQVKIGKLNWNPKFLFAKLTSDSAYLLQD